MAPLAGGLQASGAQGDDGVLEEDPLSEEGSVVVGLQFPWSTVLCLAYHTFPFPPVCAAFLLQPLFLLQQDNQVSKSMIMLDKYKLSLAISIQFNNITLTII